MRNLLMLVDDDPVVNFINQRMVKMHCPALETKVFEDGKQAYEFLKGLRDGDMNFLLLLDINMPQMDGWELLNILERSSFAKRIMVFMLSSSMADEDMAKSRGYPMVKDFIVKPLNAEKCNQIKSHSATHIFFEVD